MMAGKTAIGDLATLLSVRPAGAAGPVRTFEGRPSPAIGVGATYGGHILGQAASAVQATVEEPFRLTSFHSYFLRPGHHGTPFYYEVETVRDGRSFATRRVRAYQEENRPIFELLASCAKPEDGPAKAMETPPAEVASTDPETLPTYAEIMRSLESPPFPLSWIDREVAIDIRPTHSAWHPNGLGQGGAICQWIRAAEPLRAEEPVHVAIVAHQSDESISDAAFAPFDVTWGQPGTTLVSLDHSMWFHEPVDLNQWLYVEQVPAVINDGRGLVHARMWNQAGRLAISASQECLIRIDHPTP